MENGQWENVGLVAFWTKSETFIYFFLFVWRFFRKFAKNFVHFVN